MQALQRLQPEMKKIQARYKDDKQRQQQAMMEFYKEHQVNPLGSCLPLILQFPFFIGLYQTLRSAGFRDEVGSGGEFLFIPDITKPLTGHTPVLVVMIVIYVSTQLLSSYVSAFNIQDKNQKRLLFIFPFLFVPVVIGFEAGLLLYWITTNVWTIGQQLFIRKFLPAPEPHVAGAPAKGGGGGGLSGARAALGKGGGGGGGNGKGATATKTEGKGKAAAGTAGGKARGSSNGGGDGGGPRKPPPNSPRKKKKRSGRRR
jgi:YidC/Oxa1 family membrane protein insertase